MRSFVLLAATLSAILAGCSGSGAPGPSAAPVAVRLGYFPNVTHAAAVVGIARDTFKDALGPNITLDTKMFNAGPEANEALLSGAIDATFIGPNPAINAFQKSNGEAVRIVAGATSGGAFLVVRDGIDSAADLRGLKLSSPQLGNTQDVALRTWLTSQGYATDTNGGGDVSIQPQPNSQILQTFVAHQIDGAWVPEPWATQMIKQGSGHILVDERDLWPNGQYVTTLLLVSKTFLDQHPDVVRQLVEGLRESTDYVNENPAEAQAAFASAITSLSGSTVAPDVLSAAWGNLTFTLDPIASSLQGSADAAKQLGFLASSDIGGVYDLTQLNAVLSAAGRPAIAQP
jgi:NitT/TauT family transport system substrate-binding protein